jgi:hypothetical protein
MSEDSSGNGKVTIREVYDLIKDARVEFNTNFDKLDGRLNNIEEKRIVPLEKDVANVKGQVAVFASVISIAISVFFSIINLVLNK